MDSEAKRRLVEEAYAARAKGDIKKILAAFQPNGAFQLAGDTNTLNVLGAVEGHPQLEAVLTGLVKDYEFIKRDILSFTAEGDRAAVHSRLTIRFVPKNKTFSTELVDLFTFKDGKIASLVEFLDTALIASL